MFPYGMNPKTYGDVDVEGCRSAARATRVYAVPRHGGDAAALHSLRGSKKAATQI
jgi:hypothetical protein